MSFIGKVANFLDFGAVKINPFPKPVPCTTNQIFCQPTEQLDNIAFQFETSESTNLITNGSFSSGSTGWTVNGWIVGFIPDGNLVGQQLVPANSLSQLNILTFFDFYRVDITVTNYPGNGVLQIGAGTGSTITDLALSITSNGTFQAFFRAGTFGSTDFIIKGDSDTVNIRVDDISVIKISDTSDYVIEIIDQETGLVLDTVPTVRTSLTNNIITVDFNWADDVSVTNGCRQIQIIDNTNLFEDTFSNNQGWTIETDIVFTGTRMLFTSTGVIRKAFIDDIFVIGETYEFTLTIAGQGGDGALFLKCGTNSGTVRSSNGVFVQEITCATNGTLFVSFSGAAASTIGVDTLIIKKVDNIAGRSECYDLQTSHDCTLMFKWSNDESWGLFDYTATTGDADVGINIFEHQLRLESKFRGTKYPSARIIGDDSAGVKSMDYTSLRKVKILDIHRAPDYIHDAIAAFFMQDNRTIEDKSYIMDDEYEPSAPNDSRVLFKDLMTSRSELEQTEQPNLINRSV